MREKSIEQRLRKGIERLGGRCPKWVSPGNNGVPDRLALLPQRTMFFVETKAPGGRLSAQQKIQHDTLRRMGYVVYVLWTVPQVDGLLDSLNAQLNPFSDLL